MLILPHLLISVIVVIAFASAVSEGEFLNIVCCLKFTELCLGKDFKSGIEKKCQIKEHYFLPVAVTNN